MNKYYEQRHFLYYSKILNIRKHLWIPQPVQQLAPVLHMSGVVLYTTIEDVLQGVPAHKLKAQYPNRFAELLVCPETSYLLYCAYATPALIDKLVKLALV